MRNTHDYPLLQMEARGKMTTAQPSTPGRNRTLIIVGVVALILLCLCCLVLFVIYGLPSILGPSIGNVFSNIILTQTAVP
jgi:hypothetical protein